MSLCTKRSFYCRVHPHISMRDKFGCLHFDQKVRHGGKLYASLLYTYDAADELMRV